MKRSLALFVSILFVHSFMWAQTKTENPDYALPQPGAGALNSNSAFYSYVDVPGVVYDYYDISTTGDLLVSGDDNGVVVSLDVIFPFYGTDYSQLTASTNGYLSTLLTDGGHDFTSDCPLPIWPNIGGGARIYAYHDDLVTSVYYQYFAIAPIPNDRDPDAGASVFQWVGTHWSGGSALVDIEAFLYDNGDISFFVKSSGGEYGANATFGIQNENATEAFSQSCNVNQGADEFAFSICSNVYVVPLAQWATFGVFFLIFAFVLFRKRNLF